MRSWAHWDGFSSYALHKWASSLRKQLRQYLSRRPPQERIGQHVELGCFRIHNHYARALLVRLKYQACRRVNDSRRAHHQHQIAGMHCGLCLRQCMSRQVLPKPHDARAQPIATTRTAGWFSTLGQGLRHIAAALRRIQPLVTPDVPMQAYHALMPCALVQAIHVLRDQRELAGMCLGIRSQSPMRRIRLHLGNQRSAMAVPLPHPLWMSAKTGL